MLARLYTEEDHYRDAFHVMRVALTAYPSSPLTRNIQSEAAKTFDALFLAGKGDALPAIDALGLFYDFRELTPIGRRGDEMIRRLAERLVSVDLLDQARRASAIPGRQPPAGRRARPGGDAACRDLSDEPQAGQGAGRAARDPHRRPLQRDPRAAADDRGARAVRHRPPRFRARGDRRPRGPRGAAAALRHLLGVAATGRRRPSTSSCSTATAGRASSRSPTPSAPTCCAPASPMRWPRTSSAPRGCATSTQPRWPQGPDGRAFDVVTGGLGANSPEFREVARIVASGDTLSGFLRDLKARYPEMHGVLPEAAAAPAGRRAESVEGRSRADRLDPRETHAARLGALSPALSSRRHRPRHVPGIHALAQ